MSNNKAWCLKCKDITYAIKVSLDEDKEGRIIAKGICPICGTKTRKIMSQELPRKWRIKLMAWYMLLVNRLFRLLRRS